MPKSISVRSTNPPSRLRAEAAGLVLTFQALQPDFGARVTGSDLASCDNDTVAQIDDAVNTCLVVLLASTISIDL